MGTCWHLSANAVHYFVESSGARSVHYSTDCNPPLLLISLSQTYTEAQRNAAERGATRVAHSLPMGPLRFVLLEEKGEYSISVGIRRRWSTSVRESVDCRMPNSKKGKYVLTGRPVQTSFTCLRLAQAKLVEIAAADNPEDVEADTLKQEDDDRDTPADQPTNSEVKVEEAYDTEMPTPAVTLPESNGTEEVVVSEAPDDGEHDEKVFKEFFQLFLVPLLLLAAGVGFLLLVFMKKMFCK